MSASMSLKLFQAAAKRIDLVANVSIRRYRSACTLDALVRVRFGALKGVLSNLVHRRVNRNENWSNRAPLSLSQRWVDCGSRYLWFIDRQALNCHTRFAGYDTMTVQCSNMLRLAVHAHLAAGGCKHELGSDAERRVLRQICSFQCSLSHNCSPARARNNKISGLCPHVTGGI